MYGADHPHITSRLADAGRIVLVLRTLRLEAVDPVVLVPPPHPRLHSGIAQLVDPHRLVIAHPLGGRVGHEPALHAREHAEQPLAILRQARVSQTAPPVVTRDTVSSGDAAASRK